MSWRLLCFEHLCDRRLLASGLFFDITDTSVFERFPNCNIYADEHDRLVVDCDGKHRSGEGEPPSEVPTIPPSVPDVPSTPEVPVLVVPPIVVNRTDPQKPPTVMPEILTPQRTVPLVFMPQTQMPPPQFIEPGLTEPGCVLHKEQCRIVCASLDENIIKLRLWNYEEGHVRIRLYANGEEIAFKQSNPKPGVVELEVQELPEDGKIKVEVIDNRFPDSCPAEAVIDIEEAREGEAETPQTDDCENVSTSSACALLVLAVPVRKSRKQRLKERQRLARRELLRRNLLTC